MIDIAWITLLAPNENRLFGHRRRTGGTLLSYMHVLSSEAKKKTVEARI